MNLIALSAFTDNYIWMFHDGAHAVVGDPGDSAPVIAALDAQRLVLAAILVTHRHADHVGGIRWCGARRRDARSTLPSSIDRERRVSPFSRCDETWVAQAARSHGAASDEPVAVLTALRQWKNDFR